MEVVGTTFLRGRLFKKEDIMKELPNAKIKFSIPELQWLIIALVHAENSAEVFSNTDYQSAFKKLRKDLVKIKDSLTKGE